MFLHGVPGPFSGEAEGRWPAQAAAPWWAALRAGRASTKEGVRGDVSLGGKKTEPSDDGYTVCEIQAPSMG